MRQLPDWEWPEILILQGIFAAACAVLTNIVSRNLLGIFVGLIIGPITQYVLVAIASGFLFYVFLFYFDREIGFRQIYITLIFAAIPALILNIAAPVLPPVLLVGVAASLVLVYVGFVEKFELDRIKLRNLLIAVMVVCVLAWVGQMIKSSSNRENLREKATPESLDILEKELNLEN